MNLRTRAAAEATSGGPQRPRAQAVSGGSPQGREEPRDGPVDKARSSSQVLTTRDPDQANAVLGRLLEATSVGARSRHFGLHLVQGRSGPLTVVTAHLASGGWAHLGPSDGSLVTALLGADVAVTVPGRLSQRLDAGEVWRLDSTADAHLTHDTAATFTGLALPLHTVADAVLGVAGALGRDVAEDSDGRPVVRFLTNRPVDDQAERYWAALTRAAAAQVCGPGGPLTSPLLREHLIATLAAGALLTFPTIVADQPRGPGFTGPATMRRALEHLHAHAGEPMTVTDLAQAAGTGVRALQRAFVQHLGVTPTAHLQRVRLDNAHGDLSSGDPTAGDTVAAIARRWGFAHQGRFAATYTARYGVHPSTTLRT